MSQADWRTLINHVLAELNKTSVGPSTMFNLKPIAAEVRALGIILERQDATIAKLGAAVVDLQGKLEKARRDLG